MIMMLSIKLGLAKRLIAYQQSKPEAAIESQPAAASDSAIAEQMDNIQKRENRQKEQEVRELGEIENEMKGLNLHEEEELLEKDSE